MKLTGLLVDLEPQGRAFYDEKMYKFNNNISRLWAAVGENTPVPRAEIRRTQEQRRESRAKGYLGVHFLIRAKDGEIIGTIGVGWLSAQNRWGMLGAWIGEPDYWGGGHGSDALLLLTEYAFDWLDLRRLCLGTMDLNERAQRHVEKCGFVLEVRVRKGTFVNGEWIDMLEYGLLRDEWAGRAALVEELGLREKAMQRYGEAE
jgi:RimJ/RimL family protein N-acetyltransferase